MDGDGGSKLTIAGVDSLTSVTHTDCRSQNIHHLCCLLLRYTVGRAILAHALPLRIAARDRAIKVYSQSSFGAATQTPSSPDKNHISARGNQANSLILTALSVILLAGRHFNFLPSNGRQRSHRHKSWQTSLHRQDIQTTKAEIQVAFERRC